MQKVNVDIPVTITGRHVSVTSPMKEYAQKKVEGLPMDYPQIIEAKVILDVENYRQKAEIILYCANHKTIEADSTTDDIYSAIDETMSKVARRMRKYKTRELKRSHKHSPSIRHLSQKEEPIEMLAYSPLGAGLK